MAKNKGRGRPSKKWLKTLRKFTAEDAATIAAKCCEAILKRRELKEYHGREGVTIRLPFNIRRKCPDLPRGTLLERDMYTKTFRINANKMLDYLYDLGYSSFDSKMLRESLTSVSRKLERIDYLLDNCVTWETYDYIKDIVDKED